MVSGNVRDRTFAIAAICTLQEFQPEDASPSNVRRFDEFDGSKHQDRVKDQTIGANNAAQSPISQKKEPATACRTCKTAEAVTANEGAAQVRALIP
jgi:hypothetical protein